MAPTSNFKKFLKTHIKVSSKNEVRSKLIHLKKALQQEGEQSIQMFETYFKYTQGKATEKEMNQANEQFKDLLKTLGLGVFAILPGAPITLPLVIKWGHKFGIDIIPDSFKTEEDKNP